MSRCLGIAVSRHTLRAVAVERGRVTWAGERTVNGLDELPIALAELAAERPKGVGKARVGIAGDLVQIKLLTGLPRVTLSRLDRAVALQAGRWFLRNGQPLVTGVRPGPDHQVLGAAVERNVLEAVSDGMARAGLRLDRLGAAAGAVARLLPDGDSSVSGDDDGARVTVKAGEITAWRRSRGTTDPECHPVPGLGAEDTRFFAAYAVAASGPIPELVPDWTVTERRAAARRRGIRLALVAGLLWASAGAALVARATTVSTRARADLAALGPALEAASAVERDLALAGELLNGAQRARSERSRDAALLATTTRALPDSAYLLAVRRNRSGQVTLAGFAPSAARVLATLGSTVGIENPALQGGIVRELAGGRPVERFTLTFTWRPGVASP